MPFGVACLLPGPLCCSDLSRTPGHLQLQQQQQQQQQLLMAQLDHEHQLHQRQQHQQQYPALQEEEVAAADAAPESCTPEQRLQPRPMAARLLGALLALLLGAIAGVFGAMRRVCTRGLPVWVQALCVAAIAAQAVVLLQQRSQLAQLSAGPSASAAALGREVAGMQHSLQHLQAQGDRWATQLDDLVRLAGGLAQRALELHEGQAAAEAAAAAVGACNS